MIFPPVTDPNQSMQKNQSERLDELHSTGMLRQIIGWVSQVEETNSFILIAISSYASYF